jgi:hypothetical protein
MQHAGNIGAAVRESSQTWAAAALKWQGNLIPRDGLTPPETGVPTPSFCVMEFNTIEVARSLAGSIMGEKEDWMDEARAKRAALPSD